MAEILNRNPTMNAFKTSLCVGFYVFISNSAMADSMPGYSCQFTEPFISIDAFLGGLMYETPDKSTPVPKPTIKATAKATTIAGTLRKGQAFNLTIVQKPGSDGMSDYIRPFTGTLSGSAVGGKLTGACLKFPPASVPLKVVGVVANDTLNVRAAPNPKAPVVTKVKPNSKVWAFTQKLENGWARVAVANYPKGENGLVTVVGGWVNAKFVGKVGAK
jgi:uncharacterized membrane protein